MHPILAHGENLLLPALIGLFLINLLIFAMILTLLNSFRGKRNVFMVACASISSLVGGLNVIHDIKELVSRLPGELSCLSCLGADGFLFVAGVAALVKMRSQRPRS